MNWKAKIALVLMFVLVFSTFMHEGLQKPKRAEAAITELQAWSNVYHNTATTQQTIAYSVPAGSGTARILVVAISTSRTTVGARAVTISYGNQTMQPVSGDMADATIQQHTGLYYLDEAGLDAATDANLRVTVATGTTRMTDVFAAVYDGVNQGSPIRDSQTYNSGTTQSAGPHAFATALNVNAGDQAVEIINCTRLVSTILRTTTYATNWTMQQQQTSTATDAIRNAVANRSIPVSNTTDPSSTTFSGTALASMTGMSLNSTPNCTDTDIATLTTTNPTASATVSGALTIRTQVGVETVPSGLTGMVVNIIGSTGCNVTDGGMTWNAGSSRWEYSWNTSACGTATPDTGVSITVSGTDPDCSAAVNAAAITNVTIDNTKLPSTITSCASCHNYSPTFADGTARNNPAGQFPGSHGPHVNAAGYACSVCHVTPGATEYNHRNGTIQMASPINAETGAAYTKGTSWAQTNSPSAFTACTNLYCHSQGTSKTLNAGETRTATLSSPLITLNWGAAGACSSCHGYPPNYANQAVTWGAAKANSHSKHQTQCSTCHNATTTNSTSITGPVQHTDKTYDIMLGNGATIGSYTYNPAGGTCTTISCHHDGTAYDASRQWGGTFPATYKCITCHTVTHAITVGPLAGIGSRSAVMSEFGLAWGHKKTGRGAVADADCIVCHLEGVYATQTRSSLHADGYIDLRDPDGAGETRITDMSGTSFRFDKFSTSYAAGSRTSTGQTSNNVDNVLTQKFCIPCHDNNGATNTTARSGTGTAAMPFGGIALGANYTAANGAIGTQGLVDVKTQFTTTNSSVHPVRGPNNRNFPTAARLNVPYNNQVAGRDNAGSVKTLSVVINCFDCHTATALPTTRTIVAHGNAAGLRGTYYVASPTLCTACHGGSATYATGTSTDHGNGSALTNSSNQVSMTTCANCHASATTKPARPVPAQDYHGFNRLAGSGTDALWPVGATETSRPYAFIRNTGNFANHRPFRSSEFTSGTATCTNGGGCQMGTYTVGGSY